ncbi:hypothetical protein PG985_016189 [Apiospora marii]|uniref:Uncharacterized protein n=1 Tax=Apiospora marii TaxID=335849 RepID=A0ABR1S3A1_9PEZI
MGRLCQIFARALPLEAEDERLENNPEAGIGEGFISDLKDLLSQLGHIPESLLCLCHYEDDKKRPLSRPEKPKMVRASFLSLLSLSLHQRPPQTGRNHRWRLVQLGLHYATTTRARGTPRESDDRRSGPMWSHASRRGSRLSNPARTCATSHSFRTNRAHMNLGEDSDVSRNLDESRDTPPSGSNDVDNDRSDDEGARG